MSKKKKMIEKKVYKTNKRALKRLLFVFLGILLIMVLATPIKNGIVYLYGKTWEWHSSQQYGLQFQLPRAYQEVMTTQSESILSSAGFMTDTEVKVNEKYVTQTAEIVYAGGNQWNGILMMIQCLKTEKSSKTLDEIAEGQHILVTVNYEEKYTIGEMEKEKVKVLGTEAVRVGEVLKNGAGDKKIVSYLVPLEQEEITVIFFGDKEQIEKEDTEIRKIMDKMKEM